MQRTPRTASCPLSLPAFLTLAAILWLHAPAAAQESTFVRGDANDDGVVDMSDGQAVLDYLFMGTAVLGCDDAADINDDGVLDISDASALFNYLFLGGATPSAPFDEPGVDPTADDLDCALGWPEPADPGCGESLRVEDAYGYAEGGIESCGVAREAAADDALSALHCPESCPAVLERGTGHWRFTCGYVVSTGGFWAETTGEVTVRCGD